jgi:exodeoxyribonuclease VII large subunit
MQQKGLDFGEDRPAPAPARRRALTVSQLTERIQGVLETEFFDVWVEGEVSNFRPADSGHLYFSLKDDRAQVRAVVWRTAARLLRFKPRDGMKVLARGGVRLYAPRGEYQLSVEALEPLGKGSLQQAFEELKERLQKEGLFDPARKRPLPLLPRRIGLVTSPQGAVVRDFLRVLRRRFANLEVLIYPARVQGAEAAFEVAQGIRELNRIGGVDVLVVARGGGSLEDLWPFNDEMVARALAASAVPTMSAVGHETDFTIADFVADLRAPTPSAAAEHVVQAKDDLRARIAGLEGRLGAAIGHRLTRVRARVQALTSHRVFEAERGRVRTHAQRIDELAGRAGTRVRWRVDRGRVRLRGLADRLAAFHWERQLVQRRERIRALARRMEERLRGDLRSRRGSFAGLLGRLDSLSPLAVLSRGYALAWDARGSLVRSAEDVAVGDRLRVRVHRGELLTRVDEVREEPGRPSS